MKITHLLALALIGFIVFRLTQSVQTPPVPPAPEARSHVEYIQTSETPARTSERDPESRQSTDSLLRTILQRLATQPATTPRSPGAAEPDAGLPGPPATPAGPTPVPLPPRERLRLSEARRPALERQYGPPLNYKGYLRRHDAGGTILMESREVGYCFVEDFQAAERIPDGASVGFDAWSTGTRQYVDADGKPRTVLCLIHADPPLPLWDKFGRPINRDVLPPETIRKAGVHGETMLDPKPK